MFLIRGDDLKRIVIFVIVLILSFTVCFAKENSDKFVSYEKLSKNKETALNVKDFGANQRGKADCTKAFQNALNKAKIEKKVLIVPTGQYLFEGSITIPSGVTMEGFASFPNGESGTTFTITNGHGKEDGAFINMEEGSSIKGIKMYYPNQNKTEFVPYPWTIKGLGKNITIKDVFVLNPYNLLNLGEFDCSGFLVDYLYSHPLKRGVFVDKCSGSGVLDSIHLWPFWGTDEATSKFTQENGIAFLLGKADKVIMNSCFSIIYNKGYLFKDFGSGAGSYIIKGSGSDHADITVDVEQVDETNGVLFQNSQFMGGMKIRETNKGKLTFESCAFYTLSTVNVSNADIKGEGHITFTSSHFANWDAQNKGLPSISIDGGKLTIKACDFMEAKEKFLFGKSTKEVQITHNILRGGEKFKNQTGKRFDIRDNIIS